MKKTIGIITFILFTGLVFGNDEKIVKSEISEVTVYSQGAQIFRKASYTINKGITEVIIEGISAQIDPKSLQVKATGNVVILDSKYSLYYPTPEEIALEGLPLKIRKSIDLLEDSLAEVNYELQTIQDEIDVVQATKNILANNGAVRGQGKVNDSIALLKEAVDYYTTKMMELNKKLQALTRRKTQKNEIKAGMTKRLNDLKNYQNNAKLNPDPQGPVHRIIVTLQSNETVTGKLDISYLVSNAGWVPMYDLRSEVLTGKINLNYKAQVYQNTGIDWENVRLNISTNNPYQNKTKPELHPWYIDFYNHNAYNSNNRGRISEQKSSAKKDETVPSSAIDNSGYNASGAIEQDAIYSDQFVEVIDHLISAEFRIDLPYTIQSNNEQRMVLVKNADLDAVFKYYTAPKYDKSVYLVAQISKLDELQLVPAKANIFFDGSYIGETYLDPGNMEDTLNLSLGKDPNIVVKRTLLKTESKEKVVGTKLERTFAYAIEVKNLKSTNIEIVVQDQIPVSRNAEIEIETLENSKGTVNDRTGIIEWSFSLKPKANKDLQLKYQVKHDKDKPVYIN